ncbi:MAG: hypothetical protein ABJN18_00405 [Marinobacter sp.]|uniref:hypothetical protein n=1 Tax=Marinobacter sp. TaxID=50741 RepID=UPI003296E17C
MAVRNLIVVAAFWMGASQVGAQSKPQWLKGETLDWQVTVAEWFSADEPSKLRTAAWFFSGAIQSDRQLIQMMESGELRRKSKELSGCMEETAEYLFSYQAIDANSRMNDMPLSACMLSRFAH